MLRYRRIAVVVFAFMASLFLSPVANAQTFTVNTTLDDVDAVPGDGVCATTSPLSQVCTLRAAIMEANALAGKDTILVPSSATPYKITIPATGPEWLDDVEEVGSFNIYQDVEIIGSDPATTVIDGNQMDKVFHIQQEAVSGSARPEVLLKNLTIRGGAFPFPQTQYPWEGSGIFSWHADVTVDHCIVKNNNSGIVSRDYSHLEVNNSTISYNGPWGGVQTRFRSSFRMSNSTISNNYNNNNGIGGLEYYQSIDFPDNREFFLRSTTITKNTGLIGGLSVSGLMDTVEIENVIVADNLTTAVDDAKKHPDCHISVHDISDPDFGPYTTYSKGFNLIGNNKGCNYSFSLNDKVGTEANPINPLLGPLQNNGGGIPTHALLKGSPAIDAGAPYGCKDNFGNLLALDERGFLRTVDGNLDSIARCDIGAYEYKQGFSFPKF